MIDNVPGRAAERPISAGHLGHKGADNFGYDEFLGFCEGIVSPLRKPQADDLLRPFQSSEPMPAIQQRLATELALLDGSVKAIRNPKKYPVEFA
jgi:hypothetical protein